MEPETTKTTTPSSADTKYVYSVWALPSEEVGTRIKKLMDGLRSEFGGPHFEPHVTVVGAIKLTEVDAVTKFRSACDGVNVYEACVDRVATGTGAFLYNSVYLLLHPTAQVVETSLHCTKHFGYMRATPYMPHLTILYSDMTNDEKKKAEEVAKTIDKSMSGLRFEIARLALYKTPADRSLESWEKIEECKLIPN